MARRLFEQAKSVKESVISIVGQSPRIQDFAFALPRRRKIINTAFIPVRNKMNPGGIQRCRVSLPKALRLGSIAKDHPLRSVQQAEHEAPIQVSCPLRASAIEFGGDNGPSVTEIEHVWYSCLHGKPPR